MFYKLHDGSVKGIRSKSLLDAFVAAVQGVDTPGAKVMHEATECVTPRRGGNLHEVVYMVTGDLNESRSTGGRLHEWAQALRDDTDVSAPTPEKETTQ